MYIVICASLSSIPAMFGGSYVREHFQGHRQALARPPRHSDLPSISTNTVDEF